MDALDLNIEDGIGPDILIILVPNVASQPFLPFGLDLGQGLLKGSIVFIAMRSAKRDGVLRHLSPIVSSMRDASFGLLQ